MLAGSRYIRSYSWGKVVTCWQAPQIIKIIHVVKVITCWQAPGIKVLTAGKRSPLADRLQV